MELTTDVVVIGAGPTGLTTAALLADHGAQVTLVERASGTSDEPRAISATDETLRVMAQIGVLDALRPEMLLDTGARYFGRRGQLLAEVRPGDPRLGHPGKSQFDQPVLEALLLDAVRRRPQIEVRFGTEAFGAQDRGDHVELTVVDEGGRHTLRAGWIIGCDGGRSPLRNQLGIPLEGSTQPEEWIVVDLLHTGEHERFAEFHCNGRRPAVVVPGVKGRCRFEFMLLPGETAAEMTTPEMVTDLVEPYLHRRIAAADIRRARVYVAHQRIALSWQQGRVLLAGDAAHLMPPFAGQGLNAGIRDAANLAWKVAAAVQGTGTRDLVATYQPERRPHAEQMVRLSGRIGRVVMSTDRRVTTLRDLGITAAGLVPSVKAWLAGMRFLKQPHFTAGCLVSTASDVPAALADLVGRSLPQPQVSTEGGPTVGLDDLLGAGWTLVRASGRSVEAVPLSPDGAATATRGTVSSDWLGAGDRPISLLVRPDRYVAALVDRHDEGSTPTALAGLVPWLPAAYSRVTESTPLLTR